MSYDPKEIGAGKLITAKNDGEGGLNFFAGKTDITEKMGGGVSATEVQNMIDAAIGNAIGGAY